MIKKLQKLFSSLIVSSDVNHLVDKSYAWFITDDKKLIGILKTELTDKDMALLSTFLQPYNTQFPLPTVEEEKWKQIVEKTDESTDISCQARSEEHTSELQSRGHLVCRLLLEKKNYK